ncbi:MAG: pyridoxal phosphate-dependent aminotransferase, partial [Acidobacteriota bacterium]|nr:pyridoxal phosphate-dependent aminotransferase [Acidobacteriota bacterium]
MIERTPRTMSSPYMQWAKTHLQARFNLSSSGLVSYPLSKLSVKVEDLELSGPSYYGYEPLQKALAAKCNVSPKCVVAATGTSMANHLVMAALVGSGDEVVIEHPTYELLISAARYLGAEVKRFKRAPEKDFQINADEVARAVTERTRLIVLTNLHNPTSAFTSSETLKEVGEVARRAAARVLIDEVYLEALFANAPPSAFHLGEEFV